MFKNGEIWAYPTNTSFGLGVRADDKEGLEKLTELKGRTSNQFYSLMVKDWEMLKKYAIIPDNMPIDFFTEKPRTAILKPKTILPSSEFWPNNKVAFRISTLLEISKHIEFPITATSANKTGKSSLFNAEEIRQIFKTKVLIYDKIQCNPNTCSSEIWDYTETVPKKIR